MQIYLFVALVCLIVIAVFIFQNPTLVMVQFLGWNSPEIQLGIIVLAAVIAGALITFLLDTVRFFKVAKTIRELKTSNKKLEKINQSMQSSVQANTVVADKEAAASATDE
ncbi:MAG: DUF1049 domain-containing protein [Syntrophomonadaceae bacterium]|jgi:uncharacterized integral membrane protein|nr:DUF1049 domain-containing protein [Syntrophomonadaceae bacterium]